MSCLWRGRLSQHVAVFNLHRGNANYTYCCKRAASPKPRGPAHIIQTVQCGCSLLCHVCGVADFRSTWPSLTCTAEMQITPTVVSALQAQSHVAKARSSSG